MAIPNTQLFLDRFIEVNVERYADRPSIVQIFQGLTLAQVTFSNFKEVILEGGKVAHQYDVDMPGVFTGKNQMYYPADYLIHDVTAFVTEDLIAEDQKDQQGEAGIYHLDPEGGFALVLNGDLASDKVLALVQEKCLYDLTSDQIVVSEDLTSVTINSHTVIGVIPVVESLFDEFPRHNGQFRHDGTISYL